MVHGGHAVAAPQPFEFTVADSRHDGVITSQFDVSVVLLDYLCLTIEGLPVVSGNEFVSFHCVAFLSLGMVEDVGMSFDCLYYSTEKVTCQVVNWLFSHWGWTGCSYILLMLWCCSDAVSVVFENADLLAFIRIGSLFLKMRKRW